MYNLCARNQYFFIYTVKIMISSVSQDNLCFYIYSILLKKI